MKRLTLKGSGHVVYILFTMCVISLNFLDPINWPKQVALATLAPLIVRNMLLESNSESRKSFSRSLEFKFFTATIFLVLLSASFSNSNLFRTLWGSWGRNNGVITLCALIFISMSYAFHCGLKRQNLESVLLIFTLGLLPSAIYGFMQSLGVDPIQWSTSGQVFGPFGNTNFASAIWGTAALLSLYFGTLSDWDAKWRTMYIGSFFIYSYVALTTKSIQGPLMIGIGISLLLYIKVSIKRSRLGWFYIFFLLVSGVISGLGMFGIGPLSSYIYQYTLKLRSFYWIAGLKMMRSEPIFGIGFDSYGDFFRLFRPLDAALATGIDLTTNNAHNAFIQLFATIGFVGALGILLLWSYGLFKAIKTLFDSRNIAVTRITAVVFLLLWVISMISIDNISIATLNYVFLGLVLGMNKNSQSWSDENFEIAKRQSKSINRNPWATFPVFLVVLSLFLFTTTLICSSPDRKILETLKRPIVANDVNSLTIRAKMLVDLSNQKSLMESHYRYLAKSLYETKNLREVVLVADNGLAKYPSDFSLLDLKASALESLLSRSEAVDVRLKQIQLEPNHPLIWLNYALDLKDAGNLSEAKLAYKRAYNLKQLTSGASLMELENLREYFN